MTSFEGINGQPVYTMETVSDYAKDHPGQALQLDDRPRKGKTLPAALSSPMRAFTRSTPTARRRRRD